MTSAQHYEAARNLLVACKAVKRVIAVSGGMGRPALQALESVWDRLRRRYDADFPDVKLSPYSADWSRS